MTINQIFSLAKSRLSKAGIGSSAFDALCLIKKHFGYDRTALVINGNNTADEHISEAFFADIKLRSEGRPLQYILGEWEVFGHTFKVGDGVLIPRQDTEILIETVLTRLKNVREPVIVDLCAGSGCVAVCIAKIRPDAQIIAVELSDSAYWYLKQNIESYGLANIKVYKNDVLKGPCGILEKTVDCIAANPPYIKTGDLKQLQREVRHEPQMALDGGADGLKFYRAIARSWVPFLNRNGVVAVEIGAGQAREVSAIFSSASIHKIESVPDYSGLERVIVGMR